MKMRAMLVALVMSACGGGSDEAPGRGEFEACAGVLEGAGDQCEVTCNVATNRWAIDPDENNMVVDGVDCIGTNSTGATTDCDSVSGTVDGHLGCCVSPGGDQGIYWYECEGGE